MRRAAFFANGSRPADWRLLLGCCLSVASAVAGTAQPVPLKAHPFSLRDVRLLDGPFKRAQDLDAAYLLTLDPDRLLARFREYAGLPSKGTHYGGWEAESLSGHTLGHYLSAETCNPYNLLKLTRQLFQFDPQPAYADFYERALYNHILASQDPASGMVTYFVPLRSGFAKTYTTPFETFTWPGGTIGVPVRRATSPSMILAVAPQTRWPR